MLIWSMLLACRAEPVPTPWVDHLTASELDEATRAMTDLGPRLVATPAEAEAVDVLEILLGEAGVPEVTAEPFVWDAWHPGEARVTLGDQVFTAEPLSPSPSVSGLTAPLVASGDLTDAVALLFSDDGSRAEQFAQAAFGGAEALIRVTEDRDLDGGELVEVGHTLAGSSLPSVAVDVTTGKALAAAVGQPVTVDIESSVISGHTSYNLVARVPGRTSNPIFVTAHYDSWHPSESAFDNALGVGALVVLARQLAQGPMPERDVVFLVTSGEEQGLQGAFAWVAANEAEAAASALVINLDVMWAMEGAFFVQASEPAWLDFALEAAALEGVEAIEAGDPGIASDHFPFAIQGAPTMWNTRWPDRHYHTVSDTVEFLDMDEAAAVLRLHWRVLAEAAGVPVE